MSCSNPPLKTVRSETMLMFSTGATAPGTSAPFPVTPEAMIQIAVLLLGLRSTIIVENATPDFMSRLAFQSTEDGFTWSDPVYLEGAAVGDNRTFTTDWHLTQDDFKRGIRVVVYASQESGVNTVQMARVTVITDFQIRS